LRPSEIVMMILGVVFGLAALALGIGLFIDRPASAMWFYWISPLLAIGFAFTAFQLVMAYWVKVGRVETKGRPKK
jgi:hypothetical protein